MKWPKLLVRAEKTNEKYCLITYIRCDTCYKKSIELFSNEKDKKWKCADCKN